jgi:hypothetical protein
MAIRSAGGAAIPAARGVGLGRVQHLVEMGHGVCSLAIRFCGQAAF